MRAHSEAGAKRPCVGEGLFTTGKVLLLATREEKDSEDGVQSDPGATGESVWHLRPETPVSAPTAGVGRGFRLKPPCTACQRLTWNAGAMTPTPQKPPVPMAQHHAQQSASTR